MNDTTRENTIEVDPEQLTRELEQLDIPPDSTPQSDVEGGAGAPREGAPAPMPAAASWAPISPGIVSLVDLFVCPAWKLTPAEKDALAEALTPALDQAFPGGLGDERWAPYARLAMVVAGVALSRFDRDTGKLAPLRASAKPAASELEPEPSIAPGGEAAAGGPFTLGSGQAA